MGLKVKKLADALARHSLISLDTSVFIYHIEENKRYLPLTKTLLESLLPDGRINALCSSLVLSELLVRPLKEKRLDLVLAYKALVLGFPNLKTIPLDNAVAEQTAYFRATYNLKTPDAVHIATAYSNKAKVIICNDRRWKSIKEIEVLLLNDFVK